jgi:hypothetical protein
MVKNILWGSLVLQDIGGKHHLMKINPAQDKNGTPMVLRIFLDGLQLKDIGVEDQKLKETKLMGDL